MNRGTRIALVVVTGFVALTAMAGGSALILGSFVPSLSSVLVPPADYLHGSPFASYAVPGLALIVLVGCVQAVACVASITKRTWAPAACAVAGFGCLIWIFVQMIFIPFSPLQAIYFILGLLELGLVLLWVGIFRPRIA